MNLVKYEYYLSIDYIYQFCYNLFSVERCLYFKSVEVI